jgi:hypothetical protein
MVTPCMSSTFSTKAGLTHNYRIPNEFKKYLLLEYVTQRTTRAMTQVVTSSHVYMQSRASETGEQQKNMTKDENANQPGI